MAGERVEQHYTGDYMVFEGSDALVAKVCLECKQAGRDVADIEHSEHCTRRGPVQKSKEASNFIHAFMTCGEMLEPLTYEERRRIIDALDKLYPERGTLLFPSLDQLQDLAAVTVPVTTGGGVWCPTRGMIVTTAECQKHGCVGMVCKYEAPAPVCSRCDHALGSHSVYEDGASKCFANGGCDCEGFIE